MLYSGKVHLGFFYYRKFLIQVIYHYLHKKNIIKTMNSYDFISYSFDVTLLCQEENLSLFHKRYPLYHHLVLLESVEGRNSTRQKHLSRYELAYLFLEDKAIKNKELRNKDMVYYRQDGSEHVVFYWHLQEYSHLIFVIQDISLFQSISEDATLLSELRARLEKNDTKTLRKLDTWANSKGGNPLELGKLSLRDREEILFELALTKKMNKKRQSVFGAADIYLELLKEEEVDDAGFWEAFEETLSHTLTTESCDCGEETCFFDQFKNIQKNFFESLRPEDALDLESEIVKVWDSLGKRQKVAIRYLYDRFGISPMVCLGLLLEDFDLARFQGVICMPHQPDSDEEAALRMITTNAYNFIREIPSVIKDD